MYMDITKKFITLVFLGEYCVVYNWQKNAYNVLKNPGGWHFQFQKAKKLIMTKSASTFFPFTS